MLEKTSWSYFAFIGTGTILFLILIGIVLSPTYNFFTIFNLGRAISGALLVPYFIYLAIFLKSKGYNDLNRVEEMYILVLISGVIAAISLTAGGIFTMQAAPLIHIVAGALFNFRIVFLCFFCGYIEYSNPEIPNKYAISGFLIAPLPIIFMILFLLTNFMGFSEDIMFFFEWLSFFAFIGWIITQGIYTLNNK